MRDVYQSERDDTLHVCDTVAYRVLSIVEPVMGVLCLLTVGAIFGIAFL